MDVNRTDFVAERMDVFFGYQKLRHVLRVAVPVALGLDMIHSFYYVGCLLQEKKQLDAERRTKTLIHSTVHLFRKVIFLLIHWFDSVDQAGL